MTLTDETREQGTRGRSPLTWLVAAATLVLVAGAVTFGLLQRAGGHPRPGTGVPTQTTFHAPATPAGRCMVPSARALEPAGFAFDGTVRSAEGGRVTFEVSRWYTGQQLDRVVVDQPPQQLGELIGVPDFRSGDRYLVAATSDHRLMVCGFSAPYSTKLADLYAAAFDG